LESGGSFFPRQYLTLVSSTYCSFVHPDGCFFFNFVHNGTMSRTIAVRIAPCIFHNAVGFLHRASKEFSCARLHRQRRRTTSSFALDKYRVAALLRSSASGCICLKLLCTMAAQNSAMLVRVPIQPVVSTLLTAAFFGVLALALCAFLLCAPLRTLAGLSRFPTSFPAAGLVFRSPVVAVPKGVVLGLAFHAPFTSTRIRRHTRHTLRDGLVDGVREDI
jgi:hypothetical protein